jgi:hypothetical protein
MEWLDSQQHQHKQSIFAGSPTILYVWLVAFGATTIKRGRRRLVDRPERRDLSIFRIGRDMLERCLRNNLPISIRDVPYFF